MPSHGQPTPQQKILRVLDGGGKKALPRCTRQRHTTPRTKLSGVQDPRRLCSHRLLHRIGRAVDGVGNEATGVVVIDVSKSRAHSVVLNRTGRVDEYHRRFPAVEGARDAAVAKALGQVNSVQCGPAGGECNGTARAETGRRRWAGMRQGSWPPETFPLLEPRSARGCPPRSRRRKQNSKDRSARDRGLGNLRRSRRAGGPTSTPRSGSGFVGLDEIVLTTKDAKAANKLVDKIKSDLRSCKRPVSCQRHQARQSHQRRRPENQDRWLDGGRVAEADDGRTAKYRVGIVAAGPKVIYTFLNPKGDSTSPAISGTQWPYAPASVRLRSPEARTSSPLSAEV